MHTSAQTGEEFDYHIFVDFSKLRLYLTTLDSEIVRSYPVALPYFKMNLPVEGKVVRAIKNPWWFPTEKTRRAYFEKYGKELPAVIPSGDPLNAMGSVKIIIYFFKGAREPLRIHGTNDESSIGQRVTRGCVRMLNKDILELSELIEERKKRASCEKIAEGSSCQEEQILKTSRFRTSERTKRPSYCCGRHPSRS